MTNQEIFNAMWEAKMLGKWAPREGETLREAYARTYKDGRIRSNPL